VEALTFLVGRHAESNACCNKRKRSNCLNDADLRTCGSGKRHLDALLLFVEAPTGSFFPNLGKRICIINIQRPICSSGRWCICGVALDSVQCAIWDAARYQERHEIWHVLAAAHPVSLWILLRGWGF
jgi:hypothetical protein